MSNKVPVGTKEMIITALSQMSRLSNAFRFVDYEVDIARQDTVQNLTTILLNNNQIQLQRPALYFSGAIAFVDQNVINNRFEVGTSASRLDTGYSKTRNASVIGLDFVYATSAETSYEVKNGLNHIAVVVDDLDATEMRVKAAGYVPGEVYDYDPGRRFYFREENGIEFEIVSYS